jgi:hypothetical protein
MDALDPDLLEELQAERKSASEIEQTLAPNEARLSVTSFFCLQGPSGLRALLSVVEDSSERARLAFLGDALLGAELARLVFAQDRESVRGAAGRLSLRRVKYACNKSLATFLRRGTDMRNRIPNIDSLSDHTLGSCWEALLCSCYEMSGEETSKQVVRQYVAWVDTHASIFDFPSGAAALQVLTFDNGSFAAECDTELRVGNRTAQAEATTLGRDASQDAVAAWGGTLLQSVVTSLQKKPSSMTNFEAASAGATSSAGVSGGEQSAADDARGALALQHSGAVVGVKWTSRSKNTYEDFYCSCCGVRDGRTTCIRSLWPDAGATHPGFLRDIGGGKNGGGGSMQGGSYNHLPKGQQPRWSCCSRAALSPGCVSPAFGATLETRNRPLPSLFRQRRTFKSGRAADADAPAAEKAADAYECILEQWELAYASTLKNEKSVAVSAGRAVMSGGNKPAASATTRVMDFSDNKPAASATTRLMDFS